ncbi:MAG: hypothetical protein HYV51_00250 [Parcubacteria group bacterium]|nr:hypothetical protein [Parcubacteria group bacterium]
MIQIKRFSGPAGQQEVVKSILKAFGVPSHSASLYEENHDTGYPGLAITSTIVELNINKALLNKVESALKNLGYSER